MTGLRDSSPLQVATQRLAILLHGLPANKGRERGTRLRSKWVASGPSSIRQPVSVAIAYWTATALRVNLSFNHDDDFSDETLERGKLKGETGPSRV